MINVAWGQEFELSGEVVDSVGDPIEFVNITVREQGQQQIIGGTSTTENGSFVVELSTGKYTLDFSMVGFAPRQVDVNLDSDKSIGSVNLLAEREALDEAVINVRTPVIKREIGKLTFEVENSTLSSGNTMNLLKKTPGVLVVQDNISIRNTPTEIYINNRRVYLSSSEVAALLTNLDASAIQAIEVITNPSAKYEAEGTSGIINVVLKKEEKKGFNGSMSINTGIPDNHSVGVSLNRRTENFNFFTHSEICNVCRGQITDNLPFVRNPSVPCCGFVTRRCERNDRFLGFRI